MPTNNKRWDEEDGGYSLYFTPFYEDIQVARIWLNEDGDWLYSSSETHDDNEYLDLATTVDEAKREAERITEEHYTDERNYYEEMLRKFQEATT